MKRVIAYLLVACLCLQVPLGTLTANAAMMHTGRTAGIRIYESGNPGSRISSPADAVNPLLPNSGSTGNDGKTSASEEMGERSGVEGAVSVEFRFMLPMDDGNGDALFELDLISENGSVEAKHQSFMRSEAASQVTIFEDLPVGDYELTVQGEGYEAYQQKISVGPYTSRILLLDQYLPAYDQSPNKPGVLRLGDIDGDGDIDKDDLDTLLDAVSSKTFDASYDLNHDGEVDILDIHYFSLFYQDKRDNQSKVIRTAFVKDVEIASGSNATIKSEGNLEDIFQISAKPITLGAGNPDQAISESNPVEFTAVIDTPSKVEGLSLVSPENSDYAINSGLVTVVTVDERGNETAQEFRILPRNKAAQRSLLRSGTEKTAEWGEDGAIILDLGKQVAVKKVTIRIDSTATPGSKLADISKVEFLNNMEDRIPEPALDRPEKLKVTEKSQKFTLSWKSGVNVTGYEVLITEGDQVMGPVLVYENQMEVNNFNGEKLVNGTTYTVKVRSVNGDWRSAYCDPVKATPKALARPDAPEGITIKGIFRGLDITWKDMKDTDSYTVYYKVYGDEDAVYKSVEDIKDTKAEIKGLLDDTEYDIYLVGHNEIGDSNPSNHYRGRTISTDPAVTPNYKLINVPVENQVATDHIAKIQYPYNSEITHMNGVANPGNLNDPETQFIMTDNNYLSSWSRDDWDAGVVYPSTDGCGKSPIIVFDDAYQMDTIVAVPDDMQKPEYNSASLYYWAKDSNTPVKAPGKLTKKVSSNNKLYYVFQSNTPFEAKKIQLNFSTSGNRISIAELKFYYYDSIEKEINDLYKDDMHMELASGVDQAAIDQLRTRLNQKDDVSQEYHPKKNLLEVELNAAQQMLNDSAVKDIVEINTKITKKADGSITFGGGLSAFQPLGVTAKSGDTVVIYVGSSGKNAGDKTNLKLAATQYHGESSAWLKNGFAELKVGPNEITIPQITSLDVEQGGQLYIEYTGQPSAESYHVRVSGGSSIPVLDITKADQPDDQKALVVEYVNELERYVPEIENEHNKLHLNGSQPERFDSKNCILGATDIVTKYTMYSVSAAQVLSALSGTVEEKADKLYQSLTSMDDMVTLFYQHKGLSNSSDAASRDKLPVSKLNIRYQRMFAGAFMYAGGLHIGIEWGSIPGLANSPSLTADQDGQYISGRYFGWGIAHEIGHIINEGAYAIAEITNNYFSVLAQAKDTNDSVRFQYDEVYKKVTSGTKGRASNVFTQLGLYWQLHLAYDRNGYNYKIYDTWKDQFDSLVFARIDSYVRDASRAPKPGGIALQVAGDTDNKLMRLACAATEKNILEFFERWGMVPDAGTRQYAEQFDKETRAIWFVNDEARAYAMKSPDGGVAASTTVSANVSYSKGSNEVRISISNNASDQSAMLGYEIYRIEKIKNQTVKKPVGFVTADQTEFIDVISTVNNRVFGYEVIGYDNYLNATPAALAGEVKVSHGGVIDKTDWTVTTNMTSDEDSDTATPDDPDVIAKVAVEKVADGDSANTYTGRSDAAAPEIVLNLNKEETITGLVYTLDGKNPITNYKISVSRNGNTWTAVKTGKFNIQDGALKDGKQTIYFNKNNDSWLYAYDAAYVKITATSQKGVDISVSEFDLLGHTGDNVEFYEDNAIGVLKDDYNAGTGADGSEVIIPKDSIVFTGTYKGNPAYNTVLLYDENGRNVGGEDTDGSLMADQMIFAEVPEFGELGETNEGTWIYYIEPKYQPSGFKLPDKVWAELYRVDDAHSNEGERLVSNTLMITVPEVLPEITIQSSLSNQKGR